MSQITKKPRMYTHCLECGKELTGRPDKKREPLCKSRYHNRKRKTKEQEGKKILVPLERNDKILADLLRVNGNQWIPISVLKAMGFVGTARMKQIKNENYGQGWRVLKHSLYYDKTEQYFKIFIS